MTQISQIFPSKYEKTTSFLGLPTTIQKFVVVRKSREDSS